MAEDRLRRGQHDVRGAEDFPSIGPSAGMPAGPLIGWLLCAMSWLTAFAAGLLAPVLPQMVRQFAQVPHVQARVSLVATAPALAVALVALLVGYLSDRVGHRRILLAGLLVYSIAGTAPVFMQSLDTIIASRFVMGIGEATTMSMSSALIALYFDGAERARWLSVQVASSNVVGLLILLSGGLIGRLSWRAPFLVYALPLILLLLAMRHLHQPEHRHSPREGGERWSTANIRAVAASCLLLMFATASIGALIVDFPFLFDSRGIADPAMVGLMVGVCAFGLTLGTALGGIATRLPRRPVQVGAFLLIACGFGLAAMTTSPWMAACWGAAAGLGIGVLIPPLLNHTMANAPPRSVGLVGGLWTTAVFVGQFAGPIGIELARQQLHSIDAAIRCAGIAAAALAGILLVSAARRGAV